MRLLAAMLFISMGFAEEPAVQATSDAKALNVGDVTPTLRVGKWIKGEPVKAFAKGQIYVLEFWATWCGPCKATIPHLTELQKEHKDVVFISVNVWERQPRKVMPFVREMGEKMDYRVATDADNEMAAAWMAAAGQEGIPVAFIVDGAGKVAWIGHPQEMDEPLQEICTGKWNLKAAAAEFANTRKEKALLRAEAMQRRKQEVQRQIESLPDAERAGANAVQKLGGEVVLKDKVVAAIDFRNSNVTDSQIADAVNDFKNLKRLRTISFVNCARVTDYGLRELLRNNKSLNDLEILLLGGTGVTDEGLKEIRHLKRLQKLGLSRTKVTDVGLGHLKELTALQYLILQGTKATDKGVNDLKTYCPDIFIVK